MIFRGTYKIVYCKDEYYKEFNNNKFYKIDNKRYYNGYLIHRENGPAIEYINGDKSWYLNGKVYTKNEYLSIINLITKKIILDAI